MLKKMLMVLMLTVGVSGQGMAEEAKAKTAQKTVAESVLKPLPGAITDAILIDGTLGAALYLLGFGGLMAVPVGVGVAAMGYGVRRACKEYYTDGQSSVLCGFIGGALKYSSRSLILGNPDATYLAIVTARGALNAGLYEGTNDFVDGSNSTLLAYTAPMVIEGIDSVLGIYDGEYAEALKKGKPVAVNSIALTSEKMLKEGRMGAGVGFLLMATIKSVYMDCHAGLYSVVKSCIDTLAGDYQVKEEL